MTFPEIVAIVQARMSSSRLPGKVLLEIAGKPMLQRVIERTRQARTIERLVVATTDEPADDPIVEFCQANGVDYYRGSLHDVLDRYYQTARRFGAQVIVRITADCPLIDPALVDLTVEAFLGRIPPQPYWLTNGLLPAVSSASSLIAARDEAPFPYDFAANRLPPPWGRTYPIGLDTEVCSFQVLEIAWQEAKEPHQREHVMPFFYDHQERFRILLVNHPEDYGALRWTVDTQEDLELLRQIFAHFKGRDHFTWLETLALFQRQPELAQINANVPHKDYRQVDNRNNR